MCGAAFPSKVCLFAEFFFHMLDGKLYEVLFVNVYLGIEAGFAKRVHIDVF